MNIPIIHPEAMKPGDVIEIVAPAGPIEQRDDMMRGVASLERMGFRVRFQEAIFSSTGYLAGPDEVRAGELMRALQDPEVKAVISLRGGYGCARLIPLLQPERLLNHAKIFMGFSDLTTLHLFFRRRLGWMTVHGPMATSPALANIGGAQEMHLVRLWTDPGYHPSLSFPEMETWAPGTAEGELVGGCLSLLTASLGTPYEMVTDGKILFLEDLGEPPYRLDRMLTQLRLAGKLEKIAGILLGEFRECDAGGKPPSAEDTLREFMKYTEVPVLAHFPAGHGSDNWVLPPGGRVRLDATARTVDFLDSFTSAPGGPASQ
jgi:muramoyltetrapeptide carboxypeptidase